MENSEEIKIENQDSLKSKATKSFLVGGFSNGLQQIIGAIFGIFLARILTPADYGLIGMINIFAVIASAFQESGFVNGLANKDKVEQKDYNAVFWCSVFISSTLYLILFFCAPYIALYFKTPELKTLSRVAFLSFWVGSFGIAHNAFLFRNLLVRERAIANITALILSNTIGIILACNGFAYWGLAFQTIAYAMICSGLYWYFSAFRPTLTFNLAPIKEIYSFSSKIFISNTFININNHIYSIVLGRYYNPKDVGYVTQASKWSIMGQSVLTNMVYGVTQPTLNQIRDDRERQIRVFRKILSFTAFLTFPALFGLALISKEFILITIGKEWLQSSNYLQLLCIGSAFLAISSVFSNFLLSHGKSNVYMWSIITFGLCQITTLLVSRFYGVQFMITAVCALQSLWVFVWFSLINKYINYRLSNLIVDIFVYAILAATAALVSYYFFDFISNLFLKLFVYMGSTALIYILLNRIFVPSILLEITSQLSNMLNSKRANK